MYCMHVTLNRVNLAQSKDYAALIPQQGSAELSPSSLIRPQRQPFNRLLANCSLRIPVTLERNNAVTPANWEPKKTAFFAWGAKQRWGELLRRLFSFILSLLVSILSDLCDSLIAEKGRHFTGIPAFSINAEGVRRTWRNSRLPLNDADDIPRGPIRQPSWKILQLFLNLPSSRSNDSGSKVGQEIRGNVVRIGCNCEGNQWTQPKEATRGVETNSECEAGRVLWLCSVHVESPWCDGQSFKCQCNCIVAYHSTTWAPCMHFFLM